MKQSRLVDTENYFHNSERMLHLFGFVREML